MADAKRFGDVRRGGFHQVGAPGAEVRLAVTRSFCQNRTHRIPRKCNRVDPGIIPFGKATQWTVYPSGGEYNVAADLADCFRLKVGIVSAMVDYPIGDLIAEGVRGMGLKPFYKTFKHNGVTGPNVATVYSDQGHGVRPPVVFYNRSYEAAAQLKPGDFDWNSIFAGGVRWFHSGGIFAALSETTGEVIIDGMEAAKKAGAVVSFETEPIRDSSTAARLFGPCFEGLDREHFVVCGLDAKHRVIGLNVDSIGTLTLSIVHPREVFKPLIVMNVAAWLCGHNHPSGEVTPSQEDRALTKRLRDAGELLGITLLDHLILASDRHFSFADEGWPC